jgi:hypothetical protein
MPWTSDVLKDKDQIVYYLLFVPTIKLHGTYITIKFHGTYITIKFHGTYITIKSHGTYITIILHGTYITIKLHGTYITIKLHGTCITIKDQIVLPKSFLSPAFLYFCVNEFVRIITNVMYKFFLFIS